MKKALTVSLVALALVCAMAGCSKTIKAELVAPAAPGAESDPHAGLWQIAIPAGVGHKGVVLQFLYAGGYSYIQVEENGKKLWVAVMASKVSKGDVIEFPDSPPFANFQSKILNRTFDSVIFAAGMRNNGKAK